MNGRIQYFLNAFRVNLIRNGKGERVLLSYSNNNILIIARNVFQVISKP